MSIREEQLESLESLGPDLLDEVELSQAVDAVRTRIQVIEARMEQLEQGLVKARKEEHLLESLIALRRGDDMTPSSDGLSGHPSKNSGSNRPDAVEATVAMLEKAGKPLHIAEIMADLGAKGISPPGKGTQANLISYLRRDNRIARPARGLYGLRALGVKDYKPKSRTRSRKKRTRRPRAKTQ